MRRYALLLAPLLLAALTACRAKHSARKPDPLRIAYDTEVDWNNADHLIPLDYQQSQGKRLFYVYCVWCHADSTPAGPSNRPNLNPAPHLIDDGTVLNSMSDTYLDNIITLGGSAMGKSASMPPYGKSLTQDEVRAIIAYARAVAQPPYHKPARPLPQYKAR
ncbi:MAG TPA: cytochrome c [Terriglobia bacterium]|nr:cytochrome c [Terriglobia bacterium]